jgi:hypothetical protein
VPPSFTFSGLLRLSEPISRMFTGVFPAALALGFFSPSPLPLREPLRMLPLRWR